MFQAIKPFTMISSKNIDDIQVVPQGLDVFRCADVRLDIDFRGPNALQVFRGEEQVVRSNLAGYRKTLKQWLSSKSKFFSHQTNHFFSKLDEQNLLLSSHVTDV